MTTFVLVPGAGGDARYWDRVVPRLRAAGHAAVAVDLPGPDPSAGLAEYVRLVAGAAPGADDVVLVAQSMGAFTAVPACSEAGARRLVLLNAMVPAPGEAAGDWWENTGSEPARLAAARAGGYPPTMDLDTLFLHDVPADVAAALLEGDRPEAEAAFEEPCPFERWPDVPTSVLAGRDDRLFPVAFQQRIARERLGLEATLLPGGHLNALSEPEAVAGALLAPA